jgi:hypothetical protein
MELDELKSQLKNKLASDHAGRSDTDIAVLLGRKTNSVIGKLKRSLLKEILLSIIVVIVFTCIGIFSSQSFLRIYFSVFAVVCGMLILPLVYIFRRTTRLSSTALPVKSNLQTIVAIMEELIKRYFQFTMALIPICFVFSLLLVSNDVTVTPGIAKGYFSISWRVLTIATLYAALLFVGTYYFTKWYLRKMYGKYVAQLKECISELSEE